MILTHHGIASLDLNDSPQPTAEYTRTMEATSGTGTYQYLNYLPTLNRVKYSMSQQILKAEAIGYAGVITDLTYYVNSSSSSTRTISIYIQYTSDNVINGQLQSTVVPQNALVYNGTYSHNSGFQTIHLDTPFNYDGVQNLLITYVDNTGVADSTTSTIRSRGDSNITDVLSGYAVSDETPFNVTTTQYQMNPPSPASSRTIITIAMTCNLNVGTVSIGDRAYKTIETNGKIWMAENLDYVYPGCTLSTAENPIPADSSTTTPTCWYYNNDTSYKNPCGLLYNRAAAEGLVADIGDGWRLPTQADWTALSQFIAFYENTGGALKAVNNAFGSWPTNWGGADIIGFGMLPGGYASNTGFFQYGSQGAILCNIEDPYVSGRYTTRLAFSYDTNLVRVYGSAGYDGYSVRLVKDA